MMASKRYTLLISGLASAIVSTMSACVSPSVPHGAATPSMNVYHSLVGTNWKPADLGVGRKVYFVDTHGKGYLKTAAGLWKQGNASWEFMQGSTSLGDIRKMIFDQGDHMYVGSSLGVFTYQNHKWRQISRGDMESVDYMTIDTSNRLVVRAQLRLSQTTTSNYNGMGPAPAPVYGIEVYENGKWQRILSNVKGVQSVAFASSKHYFYGTGEGVYEVVGDKTCRVGGAESSLKASIYSMLWDHDTLYIGSSDGLWTYHAGSLAHQKPLYPNCKVINLSVVGNSLYFTVDKANNDTETWTECDGKKTRVNVDSTAIQSIAVSPSGTVAELKVGGARQAVVMIQNGHARDLHFPGSASKIGYSQNGVLTALTPSGVWIYHNGWKQIQLLNHGMVDSFYWTKDGTLYLRSQDTIPIYSKSPTPAYGVTEIWRYRDAKWSQIALPIGVRTFGNLAVSPTGKLAISMVDNARHNHIDVYEDRNWTEVASGKGLFDHAQMDEMKFTATDELTVSLAIYDQTRSGVYGYKNGHWETLLANSGPLEQKGNYWFFTTQASDATFLYIFGDRVGGFSLYEYQGGKWKDLHFHLYMPFNTMTVLPNHTLTVIPQATVAWKTSVG